MKHIFHVITSLDLGGAERVAINLSKSENKSLKFHLVEVVRGNSDFTSKLIEEINQEHIFIHRGLPFGRKVSILLFPLVFIFRYIRWRPVIIHTHTEIPDLSIFLFFRMFSLFRLSAKLVRTLHNTELWNKWGKLGARVEPFYKKRATIVSISLSVSRNYTKEYGTFDMPLIFNGVEEVKQCAFEGIDKTKINILFAGRLNYQKGINQLIQVVSNFVGDKRFDFYIIGAGEESEKLKKVFSAAPNVKLRAKIYNLAIYLHSFDYVFLPSNFEGLALLPIEASLAKTPCIINSCPGLKDTLPYDWPLKVHNNSVEDFISIFESLPYRTDREFLALEAYRYAKEYFSIENMQKHYEELYKQIITHG